MEGDVEALEADVEGSVRRFTCFQETVIRLIREWARRHSVPDSVLLTLRIKPPKKGDITGCPKFSVEKLDPHLPRLGMYKSVPKWFYGWEESVFMADGMPDVAPRAGKAELPRNIRPHDATYKYLTCERWYAWEYRGRDTPCEFGGVPVDDKGGVLPLDPGKGLCKYTHGVPNIPIPPPPPPRPPTPTQKPRGHTQRGRKWGGPSMVA
jgi:hypothetical protein